MAFKKGNIPWNKGISPTKEALKKMSDSHKGQKFTKESKRKMSESHKIIQFGKNNPNWKGGITKTSNRRWKQKNHDKVLYYGNRYKARKKNAEGSHTFGEWELLKKQYGYKCPWCGRKEPEIILSEDHIIPLSKGGSDYIENIQPLCRHCNSKKNNKIIVKFLK